MCFSAGASFAGGAVISAIGVATLKQSNKKVQMPFASIPLIFGIQQISEGFVWLALQSPGHEAGLKTAMYVFLFAAVILWPVMLPASILLMEKVKKRRTTLKILLMVGIITALYYGIGMLVLEVNPEILGHHIFYASGYPKSLVIPIFCLYIIATITPLFVSSTRNLYIMGVLITVSCLLSGIFYTKCLTSVWCFFAALISVVIFFIIKGLNKERIYLNSFSSFFD